jgi:hypothetical protein
MAARFTEDVDQQLRSPVYDLRVIRKAFRAGHESANADDAGNCIERTRFRADNREGLQRTLASQWNRLLD